MSYQDMKRYIDLCMAEYGDTLKVLVITGGECMLLKQDVQLILQYATSLGLSTRIVTNAFWATSYKVAYKTISELKSCGLKEINFSTGDEHERWVPYKNVRNASVAAAKQGFVPLINVEAHNNSNSTLLRKLPKDRVFQKMVQNNIIQIEQGVWMPFVEDSEISYNKILYKKRYERCSTLFSVIPINPYGEVLACCGLTSEYNPYMRIGNINKNSIKQIYESSFKDILKLWLFVDGPAHVLKHIAELKGECVNIKQLHICDICRHLFSDKNNLEILKQYYESFSTNVILKYNLMSCNYK